MAENDSERTEAPTTRRREEARQQGNIARSMDLTAALGLLGGILLLQVFGQRIMDTLATSVRDMLAGTGANPTRPDDLQALVFSILRTIVVAGGPLVLAVTAVTLVGSVGQVGFLFTTQPLEPNLAKLSPFKGLHGMFDMRAGARLVMNLAKVAIVGMAAAWMVIDSLPRILTLCELAPMPMFASACGLVYSLALKLAIMLLVLALADYGFQYWRRERDLRMSKQEIKEEMRRMEGDPLVKQRRFRVARQLALQRIGQSVPKADVVVTNPTHFAIALQYDPDSMKSPKVVAKGADFLAMRIRQIALASNVPLVERKELARALYKSVEVGQEVPPQFYSAVAEILAYVYRLSGRKIA